MSILTKVVFAYATILVSASMPLDVIAGTFLEDNIGVWYQLNNGDYLRNGIFEVGDDWLSFDREGYLVDDVTRTNDGIYGRRIGNKKELTTYGMSNALMDNNGFRGIDIEAWQSDESLIHEIFEDTHDYLYTGTNRASHLDDGYNIKKINIYDGGSSYSNIQKEQSSDTYINNEHYETPGLTRNRSIDAMSDHYEFGSRYATLRPLE